MVKCPECGEEVKDSNFCSNCGAKMNTPKLCPECNTELDEESIFCPECGKKIEDEEKTDATKKEEETKDEPDKEEEKPEKESSSKAKDEDKKETPSKTKKEDKKPKKATSSKKVSKTCPNCNTKIDDETVDFCPECGKPIDMDIQSFEGIKYTINLKKVIVFSLISILFAGLISIILCLLFGMISPTVDLYPVAFFISIIVIVAIFASFRDLINGGLVGIITGLVIGLLCPTIVELANGFTFSYVLFSGYGPIVFVILGAIVGIISSKYLRKSISKRIDVETIF